MVQLPTEQAIGDLPDHLPRRQGVGGWQPGDLARGAEQVARGGEQFGLDLGMLGGALQRQQNQSQTAAADSQWAVDSIQTHDAMSQQTQPAIAASFANSHDSNFDSAKSLISDPNEAAKWGMQHAPELARYKVATSDFATNLQKNQNIAGFENDSNTLMTSALSTPDPTARAGALSAITARGQSLVANGTFTPEQWQTRSAQIAHDYAVGQIKSAQDRAKPRFDPTTGAFIPGDTTELEALNKLYQFEPNAPGGWGAPAGGGPAPGATGMGTVNAPYTAPLDQPGEKGIVSPAQHYSYLISKGATPNEALMLTGAAASESSFNATAVHDNGNGYGLYGHNTQRLDLRGQPWQQQATAALAELRSRPEATLVNSAQTPQQLADAEMQFERPRGFTDQNPRGGDNYTGRLNTLRYFSQMATGSPVAAAGGGPGAAPAQRPNATNSYFIGDSVADGLRRAAGAPGDTATGRNPDHVQDAIDDADPKTLQGKTVYLSSGASNDPKSAAALASQLDSLKAKGVDMSNVRVIGVGDRADFTANGVNTTLAGIASKAGATFTGPLDPTNLRRNANDNSDNGVHLADWGKGLDQVSGSNAMAQPVGTGAGSAFIGLPPAGATGPNPHLMPPRSQWPAGATAVQQDPDGMLRYTMGDGSTQPVPGSRATGAFGHPSPGNTGTVLDALKPVERAELGLAVQTAVNDIQKQNEAATKQYVGQSKKDLDSRIDDLIAGNGVGPNETAQLQQRYARSPLPEVRQQYATFAFIKQNLEAYNGQTPAQVQADVENKQRAYNAMREANPDDPRLGIVYDTLSAAQKYAKAYSEEAFKTPLERANRGGLLPGGVTPIDPQDPNVEAAISKRVSDAHTAADSLGVPVKYFQQSERPMIKQIAQQGGQPMVDLARHIVEAAGPDAGAVFKEIGGDSQMMQWLGTHAAIGGDPEAANDVADILHARNDKSTAKELPTFDKSFMGHFADPLGGAVSRFGPAFEDRTRTAAGMLMSAQADRAGKPAKVVDSGYDQDFVDKAHNLALGATYAADGTRYGGIAQRSVGHWYSGGAQDDRVVIPTNMKATDFNDVVGSIDNTDLSKLPTPPVGKNGVPITARQIQDGRLEALPDHDGIFRGKYAVFTGGVRDDDHLVRDAQGKPWALDLAQPSLDASLRAKNPTSYLGKSIPTPATPTPRGYERTPGVVALGSAAEEQ